ncbi:HVA22-like protein f [Glycine soja]
MTLFELSTHEILAWFPIWGYLKLMFCIWLVMPMFNGAAYIYENYVRQYIKNIGRSSNYSEEYKKVLHMMTFDARKAVERYIGRYGPDAFERVVRAAEKESKKS